MSDTPKATVGLSLQEFRKRQVRDYVFPNSRLAVRIKNVGLLDLVAEGIIPQTLIQSFQSLKGVGKEARDRAAMDKLSEFVPALNAMAKAVVVFPPIADEPDDEHLGVNEIPFADRLSLFHEMNAGAEALANFRQQPDGSADTGPGSEQISPAPEPDPGD